MEDVATGDAAGTRAVSGHRRWAALAVLVLPVILIGIDNTVLSFALPQISESIDASSTEMTWIVDIYPLMLAGLLVSMGSLGDRLGRRRLLLLGGTGFLVVSFVAAYAGNAGQLIATRALLGVFGATLMPSTLSLVRNIFPDATQRRTAIAIWATGFSAGAAIGPVVGGLLLEHFWWGSVLLINVPTLGLLLILGPRLIPESRDPEPGPLDPLSIVLAMSTTLPFVYSVKLIAHDGLALPTVAPLGLTCVAGTMFVRRQLRRPAPLLDVRLFSNPTFAGTVVINLLSVFGLIGFIYFGSQFLQQVLDVSPMTASAALVPGLVLQGALGLSAVVLVRYRPPQALMATGLGAGVVGFLLAATLTADAAILHVALAFLLLAGGIGLVQTLANDIVVAAVPPEKAGAASGVSETAYELGAALGAAVLGSLVASVYRDRVEVPASAEATTAADDTLGDALDTAARLPPADADSLLGSARDAFADGVTAASVSGAVAMALATGVALAFIRRTTTP